MARLIGPLQLRGSIGELTFYAGENGKTLVKAKSSPNEWQMKHGEQFARTRRINAEWKVMTKASKCFRVALGHVGMKGLRDRDLSGRMNSWLLPALRADKVSEWGERCFQLDDHSLLEGFEFNKHYALEDVLPVGVVDRISVEDKTVWVQLPGFRLRRAQKKIPREATHFRMVSQLMYVDLNRQVHSRSVQYGGLTAIGRKSGEDFVVEHTVEPAPGQMSFWLLGIEFYVVKGSSPDIVRGTVMRVMKVWGA